jgi:hypothetical protein
LTSPRFDQPFRDQEERNEAVVTLQSLASNLATLSSMARRPASEWSAEDLANFPPVAGEEGTSVPDRLRRWASEHADEVEEVRRLAASPTLGDEDVHHGLRIAEGAFAALLGLSIAAVDERVRSEAGATLRGTPRAQSGSAEQSQKIMVRPRPNEHQQRMLTKPRKSWLARTIDPSDSWWEKGALVVDRQGPALIDADGIRHPFPEARGGFLVQSNVTVAGGAPTGPAHYGLLFVAASPEHGQRVLLRLPNEGFGETAQDQFELDGFARGAGLTYALREYGARSQDDDYPGFKEAPSLEWAIHDQATRDRSLKSRLHRARRQGQPDGG